MHTRTVTLESPDGPMRAYEAVPDASKGAIIVIPEAFGLNGYIESVTHQIAEAGYTALALDVFHRSGGGTAEYGDFEKVMTLFAGLDGDEQIMTDIDEGLGHLHLLGFVDDKIGVIGFCFGGRVSFLTALRRPIGAGVGFYGGGIASAARIGPFPALIDNAPSLQVPWLGLFGDNDPSIPVDDVERLRKELKKAKAPTDIVRFAGAGHGFHCDQRADYAPEAAAQAWQRAIEWFDHHVGR